MFAIAAVSVKLRVPLAGQPSSHLPYDDERVIIAQRTDSKMFSPPRHYHCLCVTSFVPFKKFCPLQTPRIGIQLGGSVPEKRPGNLLGKNSQTALRFIIFLLCCLEALDRFMQHFPNRKVIGTPFLTVTTFSAVSCLFHCVSEHTCE
jgi:hypothetical protein